MDKKIQHQELNRPDYKRIYQDMIMKKFPEKADLFSVILKKESLSFFDILTINKLISGTQEKEIHAFDQMLKSYDKGTIKKILEYQKKNNLNNSQLAIHFKLSRNTITKWKKIFNEI